MSDTDEKGMRPADGTPARSGGCPRWVRITLFLSIALNLLVAGAIAGAILRNDGRHGRPAAIAGNMDPSLRPFAQALTIPQRRAVGEVLMENAPRMQASSQAIRGQLNDMLEVLRSEDFSASAFDASIRAAQAGLNDRQNVAFAALIAQVSAMSDDERLEFADRLERSFKRKPARRR